MNAVHPGVTDTEMGQQTIDVRAKMAYENDAEPARGNLSAATPSDD